ncbi:MAG: acyl-[ACP]--phospholipid O-acyltransferase [Hyphomicrobiaceae bacterium]
MFASLMFARRFAPLFWSQFLSALNDNLLKQGLVILITLTIANEQDAGTLVALAGAVFILPYFFLSALGGELADKHDKADMAERVKLAEIAVALVAVLGFYLASIPVLFVALFLFGCVGALFGPVKYGILPDHLKPEELSAGNALVEGATFIAILSGTILASFVVGKSIAPLTVSSLIFGLAILCWLSAKLIPKSQPAAPALVITKNPLTSTFALLRELRADNRLRVGGHIVSWFWAVGGVCLSLLPTLIHARLGGDEKAIALATAVFTVGIAVGSIVAAKASHHRPNLALVPLGALLMGIVTAKIGFLVLGSTAHVSGAPFLKPWAFATSLSGGPLLALLFALAFAGGLFIVPAFTAVQGWAPVDHRARVIAAVNVMNAAYMVLSAVAVAALQAAGVGVGTLFLLLGLANLVVFYLVLRAWGREGVQDLGRFLFKLFLRLEVKGAENLPKDGERVIIAPNHISLLDGPIMHAILPGHASFAVDTGISQAWWAKPFLKLINALSIDPTKPLAARAMVNVVKGGKTVVIFPEGRITVTGGLMKVYDGTAMIADKADAWVVPVRIEGPERSPLGYMRKTQVKRAWFPKTTVTILPARKIELSPDLKGKARRQAAGAKLQDIMVDTAVETARIDQTLFEALVEARQLRDTGKVAVEDPLGTKLSYKKLILGAQILGAKLASEAPEGAAVGVLLPNAAGVAVTFFALQSTGRVAAMLNFTSGAVNVIAACRAAKVEVVLTSQAFIEKGKLTDLIAKLKEAGIRIVNLEDVKASIGTMDKIRGLRQGSKPQSSRKATDPAVILFTSGSEGTPKGVVLSHRNILANVAQALARIAANGDDKVFNVLPVFHSFGLTGGMMMPLIGGVPLYLYPSPLHYRIVPELVYGSNATIMFGTDTFLNGYARTAHPYDFHKVRLIMAGAEAVKDRTRATYMEKFGVRVLEGYGVTETAPLLAMNTPLANRVGTVGRLSPLMQSRLDPVPGIEEGGRLYVRGPNVMLGYFRAENPGVLEPPAEGWHDTGDIVTIDADGYIKIRGRAKRFAKIAGEMVSLSAVEAMAAEIWPKALSLVVALPDPRKGERLILLTQEKSAARAEFSRHAKLKGASELNVPAEFIALDSIPLLGSGKPDYVAAQKLAAERATPPRIIEDESAAA